METALKDGERRGQASAAKSKLIGHESPKHAGVARPKADSSLQRPKLFLRTLMQSDPARKKPQISSASIE
jgi:hypothetical protein